MADKAECAACRGQVHPDATRCQHCGMRFHDDKWWTTRLGALALGGVVGLVAFVAVWAFVLRPGEDRSEDRARECAAAIVAGDQLEADRVCP